MKHLEKVKDQGGKMWYKKTEKQKVVYCPPEIRTVTHVEDICCKVR